MSTDDNAPSATREDVTLDYNEIGEHRDKLLKNISAVAQSGRFLWLGSDEKATIQCLARIGDGYGHARTLSLRDYFPLPNPAKEVDVEALAIDGGFLWIAGSHSRARDKDMPVGGTPGPVEKRPARCFLGRLRLSADGGSIADPADGRQPCLPFAGDGNVLTEALAGHPAIGPFLALPDKENGLDIEGMAVRDGKILLGCRGPVIRGHALVVELSTRVKHDRLVLDPIGEDGALFRLHFLPLDGLGIRDFAADGDDIMAIAGPTMGLSGPFALVRWIGAFRRDTGGIAGPESFRWEFGLVLRPGEHPEGIARFDPDDGRGPRWLVVHDNPDATRTAGGRYIADQYFPSPAQKP